MGVSMKELFNGLMRLPKAIGLTLQAVYIGSHALRTYAMVHRVKSDKALYGLLSKQENLTKEQKQELNALVKEYKKTLRKEYKNVDNNQTN